MFFLQAYAAAGTLNQNYANILLMLLRLRQACDHPLLVKGFSTESIGRDSMQMGKNLPKDMLINLMKHLDTSSAICCVCNVSSSGLYPFSCVSATNSFFTPIAVFNYAYFLRQLQESSSGVKL